MTIDWYENIKLYLRSDKSLLWEGLRRPSCSATSLGMGRIQHHGKWNQVWNTNTFEQQIYSQDKDFEYDNFIRYEAWVWANTTAWKMALGIDNTVLQRHIIWIYEDKDVLIYSWTKHCHIKEPTNIVWENVNPFLVIISCHDRGEISPSFSC